MDEIHKQILKSFKKNLIALTSILPIFLGVILLISLVKNIISDDFYINILSGNIFIDSLSLNILGSIMTGNALNSYIISGDMMEAGITVFLALLFSLAWVTVGFVQIPAESILIDKKFAITRNIVAFISNFIVSFIVISLLLLF